MRYVLMILLTLAFSLSVHAEAFGSNDDVSYAKSLWNAMTRANLTDPKRVRTVPYDGQAPHGKVLETIETTVTVHNNLAGPNGDTGVVIVKRNYGGDGVSKEAVANNPDKYLKAVTVMFKRPDYDPENEDWFWVKYLPSGQIDVNPKNKKLAGRVAKGMDKGCIACHQAAPGGDYVFNHGTYQ